MYVEDEYYNMHKVTCIK